MGLTDETGGKPVRIAIVGAGYMAEEHAKAFASLPNVSIAGVVGRNHERARRLAESYGAKAYGTVEQLFTETRADAVVVAVNELSMRSVCIQVSLYPWTSLLEKPVGLNLDEAGAILNAFVKGRSKAFVALNRRSYSSTRDALAYLQKGDGPRLISVMDQQDLEAVRASGQPAAVVDNYMFANSIHLVDYLTLLGRGTVTEVRNVRPWTPDNPAYVVASVHFDSGDIGLYQAVWRGPGPWSVTVSNAAIRVELRPLEKLSVQNLGERMLTEVPVDPIDEKFKPGLYFQASELCRAVQGEETTLCNLEENFRSMRLCAQIYGLSVG